MVVMLMAMMVGSMVILLIVPTKKRERKHDVEELGSNAEQVVVRGVGSTDRPIVDSSHIVLSPTTYFPIHPPHPSLPPPKPSAYHNLTLKQTNLLGVPISGFVSGCNHYQADTMPKTPNWQKQQRSWTFPWDGQDAKRRTGWSPSSRLWWPRSETRSCAPDPCCESLCSSLSGRGGGKRSWWTGLRQEWQLAV